jgi:DNA repair photolyase
MEIAQKTVKSILTPQRGGFLSAGPYPFTHSLSAYIGCGFGQTTCGMYCYAQFLPNWSFSGLNTAWGRGVLVKSNAAEMLEKTLRSMKTTTRQRLRIIMSSTTDPYQPLEHYHQITRQCLEVFARYDDLDLLLIQTRSPLAERDLAIMQHIHYAWLSVTIETDQQAYLKSLRGGPPLAKRWELVRAAAAHGVATQIAISPCLPFSSPDAFGQLLLHSGARRLVVDTVVDGDGAGGERTARSPFARAVSSWNATSHAHSLFDYLLKHCETHNITVGWSSAGFSGITPSIS